MSKKIIIGVVILALLAIVAFLYWERVQEEKELSGEITVTPGVVQDFYLLNSTSTTAAWSDPIFIAGANKVTFFIGESVHTGTSINTLTAANEYTFEVSDVPEPQQAAFTVGTTSEIVTDVNTVASNLLFSTSTPFSSTAGGTTTVSLDLSQNTFRFVRVTRTAAAADTSTGTVRVLLSY